MTKLELLNRVIQIFFIRVYVAFDTDKTSGGRYTRVKKGYGILYFVVPFTGWDNKYKSFLGKPRYTNIIWK